MKFEVFKGENDGKFYFNLKAGNGQVILSSQGYVNKEDCLSGVESVRNHAADEKYFEVKESADGKGFFNLKASNGQVIGRSQMYASESGLKNGIESIQARSQEASVEDLTQEA